MTHCYRSFKMLRVLLICCSGLVAKIEPKVDLEAGVAIIVKPVAVDEADITAVNVCNLGMPWYGHCRNDSQCGRDFDCINVDIGHPSYGTYKDRRICCPMEDPKTQWKCPAGRTIVRNAFCLDNIDCGRTGECHKPVFDNSKPDNQQILGVCCSGQGAVVEMLSSCPSDYSLARRDPCGMGMDECAIGSLCLAADGLFGRCCRSNDADSKTGRSNQVHHPSEPHVHDSKVSDCPQDKHLICSFLPFHGRTLCSCLKIVDGRVIGSVGGGGGGGEGAPVDRPDDRGPGGSGRGSDGFSGPGGGLQQPPRQGPPSQGVRPQVSQGPRPLNIPNPDLSGFRASSSSGGSERSRVPCDGRFRLGCTPTRRSSSGQGNTRPNNQIDPGAGRQSGSPRLENRGQRGSGPVPRGSSRGRPSFGQDSSFRRNENQGLQSSPFDSRPGQIQIFGIRRPVPS